MGLLSECSKETELKASKTLFFNFSFLKPDEIDQNKVNHLLSVHHRY